MPGDFFVGVNVPAAGLVVTTLEFQALDAVLATAVDIAPTAGLATRSRVLGAGDDLGVDLTGNFQSTSLAVTECQINADCDDANVCTGESCNSGVCVFTNNANACEDGLFCTAGDTCSGGICGGGPDPCPWTAALQRDVGCLRRMPLRGGL